MSAWARGLSLEDRRAFADLARSLAGGAPAMPWWAESHDRIIRAFLAGPAPERLVDIETRACVVVGDEFYARLNSPDTGLAPAQWLRALIEEVGARLQAAIAAPAAEWPHLLAFLWGLSRISPSRDASPDFPDIRFPRQAAAACLATAAKAVADGGLSAAIPLPDDEDEDDWLPGEALLAQDAYGSRFLLAVPFTSEGDPTEAGHWYAWDIDACWLVTVVSAGVFESAEAALAEWRGAVGVTAAGAGLSRCRSGVAAWLLGPAVRTGALGEMFEGGEHRELIREYFRSRRRGQVVLDLLPDDGEPAEPVIAPEIDTAPFVDWYAGRHGDVPKPGKFRKVTAETAEFLLEAWGPNEHPAQESVYACSPHRIEMLGRLVRDDFLPKEGNAVLRMLPDWVQWCADRTGLPGELAEPALEAARAEAANLIAEDHVPDDDADDAPFRRREL
ncbi:MAG TPA: hypothetical protein VFO01_09230 [Trebonia sp.]|nr:hypothetical protein [Trebonia sp.]